MLGNGLGWDGLNCVWKWVGLGWDELGWDGLCCVGMNWVKKWIGKCVGMG